MKEKWMIRGMLVMIIVIFLVGFVWPVVQAILDEL